MALDIRLDFISKINPLYIENMTEMRKSFIIIDDLLKILVDEACKNANFAAMRAIELSRAANESACQYAIKSLCLLGEVRTMPVDDLPSRPA